MPKAQEQVFLQQLTNVRPHFETEAYYNLQAERAEETEELLSKFYIDIKDSLALAYEATANANVHHFTVGQMKMMKMALKKSFNRKERIESTRRPTKTLRARSQQKRF